ncbi:flagellar hook-length control protein FliK [Paenibacillus antibioticophila]|uniref:flagellar hook-length control protein FliK n=1 Tax=Paenibacillus antibioticophila TaxID=1274374 RepID=UPI000677BDD3|nr:flagellar hook-length control protein FliK [Paenibacillus antibioticophila]
MQQQVKESDPTAGSKQAAADSTLAETDGWIQSGTIVTAGQLALRDHSVAALKIPANQVPVEKFSDEVGKFIVNKLEIIKAGGVSEARISLYPEHLGQVDVKITMQNGHMVAQFVTEHLFAKESLEGQMAQLRSALQSQGLQVNKLEVTQNVGLSSHMYQDGRQQGSSSNLNQQHSDRQRNEVREEDFLSVQDLNEEWTEWMTDVRTREAGLGSSFVARV